MQLQKSCIILLLRTIFNISLDHIYIAFQNDIQTQQRTKKVLQKLEQMFMKNKLVGTETALQVRNALPNPFEYKKMWAHIFNTIRKIK